MDAEQLSLFFSLGNRKAVGVVACRCAHEQFFILVWTKVRVSALSCYL